MTHPRPTDGPSLRRRLADARAVVTGTKGLRARVAKDSSAIATLRTRLTEQQRSADRQDQRLKELEARLKQADRALALEAVERERRDAQFGTLEARLADLEQGLSDSRAGVGHAPVDEEQLGEGRDLLEAVRTEHARIRARMQVVSAYEERLRRVEESVAELYDGDRRHPV